MPTPTHGTASGTTPAPFYPAPQPWSGTASSTNYGPLPLLRAPPLAPKAPAPTSGTASGPYSAGVRRALLTAWAEVGRASAAATAAETATAASEAATAAWVSRALHAEGRLLVVSNELLDVSTELLELRESIRDRAIRAMNRPKAVPQTPPALMSRFQPQTPPGAPQPTP